MNSASRLLISILCVFASTLALAQQHKVLLKTSAGEITIALDAEKAPKSVANFLAYVDAGFYDGTIFHRVIPDFMIQGGGLDPDMQKKPTREPVENEAANGLKNVRGSIAMARTNDPHSATAQFFINHKDNPNLDHPSFDGWGYAVFGRVSEGMDVVDTIAAVKNGNRA
jgi:cyclophilin family peptidyl-prolyl cis-trans isomerase